MPIVSIELRKVYRQTDDNFIAILDRIRNNTATSGDLAKLNSRVKATHDKSNHSSLSITLAARRDTVDFINEQQLSNLDGAPITFKGEIKGNFPESSLPTPMELQLKPGAQVIFIKNDKNQTVLAPFSKNS